MNDYLADRCEIVATYVVKRQATVRQAAKFFKVSKSTVYKDITERVKEVDVELAKKARQVLEKNKAERSIRGGMATKAKYSRNKSS